MDCVAGLSRLLQVQSVLPDRVFLRLLAELHHSKVARIRVAGGGAGGDAPAAQASALGLPYGQPQPPKRLSPSSGELVSVGNGTRISVTCLCNLG